MPFPRPRAAPSLARIVHCITRTQTRRGRHSTSNETEREAFVPGYPPSSARRTAGQGFYSGLRLSLVCFFFFRIIDLEAFAGEAAIQR